jgi:hypothetical protein
LDPVIVPEPENGLVGAAALEEISEPNIAVAPKIIITNKAIHDRPRSILLELTKAPWLFRRK